MKKQAGFSLVMAVFILVVLGLLGGYMVKLSGVQHATSSYAIQGVRAYQSAKTGVSWAVARISAGGDCSDVVSASPMSFADINGFLVTLTCSSQAFSEGINNLIVYKLSALSEFGAYNSAGYVSRRVEVSVVKD
jgi:MSHA biogenesis protein MshP